MARRNPNKPEPVKLTVGGKTLATAYARRAPGTRRGKEHWAWEVHFTAPDGTMQTQPLGRLAEELVGTELARFYQEVDPAAVKSDGSGVSTVGDLLRAYFAHLESRQGTDDALAGRTLLFYEGSSKRLVHVANTTPLADLSEPWVLAIRNALLQRKRNDPHQGYSARTVKADLKFLRQAVLWGQARGLDIPDVKVTRAQKFKGRKAAQRVNNDRTPTEAEVEALYGAMRRSGTKLAMYIMWQTGCRVGEAGGLRWGDVHRDENGFWADFPDGKTGPRRTPITEDAHRTIHSFRPDDAGQGDGLFRRPVHMSKNTGAAISEACKVGGRQIEPFTSHGLRRLFTDRCIRAGVDLATYADIAGHSIETALKHYRKVTDDDRLAALHRLTSPSSQNVVQWLARHNMTDDEAIRVLSAWVETRSEAGGLREGEAGGSRPADRTGTPASADGLDEVAGDHPAAAPAVPPGVVH